MSLLILRGLLLAAEALLISALLPLLAWAAGGFFRKNAAMRHLLWLAVFAMLLALPLLALLMPAHVLALQPAAQVPVDVVMAAPMPAAYAQNWSLESIIAVAVAPLCALWLAGLAWNLLRLALGAHGLMRMRRNAVAFDRIANCGRAAGCDVRLGGGPLTFGALKPVIILPHDAPHWPRERLDAVLRHELAHVRRLDSVTQWLAALVCAFYWPNPLVWLGAKSLRRDAEMAADDMVLASGVQPSVYAAELVRLAADVRGQRFAVAMASPSSLEARVTSVLSPTPSRKGATPMDALKLGLAGSACAVALALARPDIALAQAAQPAPVTSAPLAAPAAAATPAAPQTPDAADAAPSGHKSHQVRNVTIDREDGPDGADLHVVMEKDGVREERHFHAGMSAADREKLRQTLEQVHAQMAQIHPQVEKAMLQAQVAREQARAIRASATANAQVWREASNEIRQAVHQAMDEIRPYIREAAKDPQAGDKIGQKVNEAMAKVQPQIDAAVARANAAAAHVRAEAMPPMPPLPPMPPVPPPPPAPTAQ